MNPERARPAAVLEVHHLSKSFPGVRALDDVQLTVRAGEVHALMGENGAGKSTLMKILSGWQPPDAGEIRFHGEAVRFRHPHAARRRGIAMIHQELLPFPDLSVAENIFMGCEPATRWLGWIQRGEMEREAGRLLERLGIRLDPKRRVRELGVAEVQIVEIAKALAGRAEVIIMDEPTSALSEHEVEALFAVVRDLRQQGVAIIYVSHKLDEVFRLADTVTVLRDGRHIATEPVARVDRDRLIRLMVGRELSRVGAPARPETAGAVALSVRGLSRFGRYRDINFDLHAGEVLGLAGLMGAGRTEVAEAIFGLTPPDAGEMRVHGKAVRLRHPREALAHGIGLVSEDRKVHGLVPTLSVAENITLAALGRCSWGPFISGREERRVAAGQIRALGIRAAAPEQNIRLLSGGNQQKVVLAKALLNEPSILILDEPTRGIDVGAKAEIYRLISALAGSGKAILLISSELPELLALSHRLLVLCQGRLTAALDPRQTSAEAVLHHAMPAGGRSDAHGSEGRSS